MHKFLTKYIKMKPLKGSVKMPKKCHFISANQHKALRVIKCNLFQPEIALKKVLVLQKIY